MEQKKKAIFFLPLLLIILFLPVKAQEIWKLEDCIAYAFDNNIRIKQQVLNTIYNQNNLKQSKAGLLPSLNAGGSQGFTMGKALDPVTYDYTDDQRVMSANVNLNSQVTLFSGLKKMNTIRQNEFNLMASLQDLEKLKNDIALLLASAYLQILFNEELAGVAQNQLDITNQQVDRTAKLVEAGSLARGSLLEIKAQAASEELNLITAQNQLDIAYLNLTQILDLDSVGDFTIEIPEFELFTASPITITVNSVFEEAMVFLPQIRSAELQLQSAEQALSIAQGSRSPVLSFNGNFGTGFSDARRKYNPATNEIEEYPFSNQMNDFLSTSLALGLQIPIFNGWMVNTGISNAKLNLESFELELETTKNNLYKSIQQSYADAVAGRKKYLATEEALVSMEESFKYTEQKYEVGLVNTVDYNSEKNRLILTQSDLLQAKYDYIFKMKILDFYRGIPLSLQNL